MCIALILELKERLIVRVVELGAIKNAIEVPKDVDTHSRLDGVQDRKVSNGGARIAPSV